MARKDGNTNLMELKRLFSVVFRGSHFSKTRNKYNLTYLSLTAVKTEGYAGTKSAKPVRYLKVIPILF